jgi:hypothetical protein
MPGPYKFLRIPPPRKHLYFIEKLIHNKSGGYVR